MSELEENTQETMQAALAYFLPNEKREACEMLEVPEEFSARLEDLHKNPVVRRVWNLGEYEPYLPEVSGLRAYLRHTRDQWIIVMGNDSTTPLTVEIPGQVLYIWLNNQKKVNREERMVTLQPYQVVVFEYYPGNELPF